MRHALLLLLLLPLMLNAQGKPMKNSAFLELADQFMKESLQMSPVSASGAGYHKYADPKTGKVVEVDALLDDMGPESVQKQIAFYKRWQEKFQALKPASLDKEDQADLRLVSDQIALGLLDLEVIKSFEHNPTGYVEFIGNALFLPMTQDYAPAEVRMGHVLSRVVEIPRAMSQAKQVLKDADPIYISTAVDENNGNIEMIESLKDQIPASLKERYEQAAPTAIAALKDFNAWLQNDLAKRPTKRTWRLGKEWYAEKFRLVMETPVTPEQILATAEQELKDVRAEMLGLALPMHKQMYPEHTDHADLSAHDRENKIISEVISRISDEHADRDHLLDAARADVESITKFIRESKIVALGPRDNLKVIPTPVFMRGVYSVGGFHSAPPLEPNAEAQYWVTPIDPKATDAQAESKLREYNNYGLQWLTIHEALPGHYVQFEHANDIQPETRRLLRALYSNGAYVEGWAEYIAQVMMDEGFLNHDPKFRLVMRKIRLRVISNVILDIRMHTMNMSDAEAMKLMVDEAFQTQAEADGKLRRAKLSSTQLPTYYVGLHDWLTLRKNYQAAMGKKFNMEEFHNKALNEGPLPIMYLREIIMPPGSQK